MGKADWESANKPVWHTINRGVKGPAHMAGQNKPHVQDATAFCAVNWKVYLDPFRDT